jgi:two-component system, OmpR family, alkaline phosphatase synthesis response regulator PhoP
MSSDTPSILVIEDDADIARLLQINLDDAGYDVTHVADGLQGLQRATTTVHDLLILDLSLPSLNGMEICRRLRQAGSALPILMLTARTEETDKVLGLELGADDYLTKPFSIRELLARVRSILRRVQMSRGDAERTAAQPLRSGELELDVVRRRVTLQGETIDMTAKEFDLLQTFMAHPGRAFSRQQLLEQVWGYVQGGYEHTLNTHVNRLRSKIEPDPSCPCYVLTVWGVGYRFREDDGATE